jgi:DNA (cytosine-5)-methyltransferase 1
MDQSHFPIRTLDTFSGIGGVSLALQGAVRTVLYCEINPYCQRVLAERMSEGKLERGPIHGDIKTLHIPDVFNIELITGGSPCTDISSIGLQQGIVVGPQSSLFFEILRLADSTPTVKMLFLENVANILKVGIKDVVEELTIKRNYDIYWTIKSAASIGAPHVRKRWFCLAIKRGHQVDVDHILSAMATERDAYDWQATPNDPHVCIRPGQLSTDDPAFDKNWVYRAQCLGNTVVPCVVRGAFTTLVKMHRMAPQLKDLLGDQCGQSVNNLIKSTDDPPETCAIVDGCCVPVPNGPQRPTRTTSANRQWTIKYGGKETTLTNLPTPRHGMCHASSITDRSLHDLPTVLVHNEEAKSYVQRCFNDDGTPPDPTKEMRHIVVPNVRYIEWMMGYGRDWTRVSPAPPAQSQDHKTRTNANITPHHHQPKQRHDKQRTINALNLFHMEKHPHVNLRDVCKLWRDLGNEERNAFSERAKAIRQQSTQEN